MLGKKKPPKKSLCQLATTGFLCGDNASFQAAPAAGWGLWLKKVGLVRISIPFLVFKIFFVLKRFEIGEKTLGKMRLGWIVALPSAVSMG